jgi:hypothetical protein
MKHLSFNAIFTIPNIILRSDGLHLNLTIKGFFLLAGCLVFEGVSLANSERDSRVLRKKYESVSRSPLVVSLQRFFLANLKESVSRVEVKRINQSDV